MLEDNNYGLLLIIKLILLGDSSVGKTCLLLRYLNEEFSPNHLGTIGIDFKIKKLNIENNNYKIQIWDTSGVERCRNITKTYIKGTHGFIFIYDVSYRNSFQNIKDFLKWLNVIIQIEMQ